MKNIVKPSKYINLNRVPVHCQKGISELFIFR